MENCLRLSSEMTDAYKQIKLPITTIDDITGIDSDQIVLFSDYGPLTTKYETYAYYLTDGRNLPLFTSMLQTLKELLNIKGERIQYKSRKKPLKKKAFPKWIELIRSYPGLLYVVAFDTRLEKQLYIRPEKKSFKAELESADLPDSIDIYKRMIRAAGFIVTLLPYFQSKHKLLWITDNDDTVMTGHRKQVFINSVGNLIQETNGSSLSEFEIYIPENTPQSKEFDDNCEEFLSIPDMVASAFGHSLDYDVNDRFNYRDREAKQIIHELSKICDLKDYKIERRLYCTFGSSLFDFHQTEDKKTYYLHKWMKIAPEIQGTPLVEDIQKRIYIKGYR